MEKFTLTPDEITHHHSPAFQASWCSGEDGITAQNQSVYYYPGSGKDDSLLLYRIEWTEKKPDKERFHSLMNEAITALDHWIAERF